MKKLLSLVLVAIFMTTCFVNIAPSVYAAELSIKEGETVTYTMSEYDMYVEMKQNNTRDSRLAIDTYSIEDELLKVKELSDLELTEKYGYTSEQIEILRNYDGAAIEESPELRTVLGATLTASLTNNRTSSSECNLTYSWTWSKKPFNPYTDIVGIHVSPLTSQGATTNVTYTSVTGTVKYYTTGNIYVATDSTAPTIGYRGSTNTLAKTVPIEKRINTTVTGYAKTGSISARCIPAASGTSFGDVKVYAAYGHSTTTASPSFDVSGAGASVSISFISTINVLGEDFRDFY